MQFPWPEVGTNHKKFWNEVWNWLDSSPNHTMNCHCQHWTFSWNVNNFSSRSRFEVCLWALNNSDRAGLENSHLSKRTILWHSRNECFKTTHFHFPIPNSINNNAIIISKSHFPNMWLKGINSKYELIGISFISIQKKLFQMFSITCVLFNVYNSPQNGIEIISCSVSIWTLNAQPYRFDVRWWMVIIPE